MFDLSTLTLRYIKAEEKDVIRNQNTDKSWEHYFSNAKYLVQTKNTNEIYRHCIYNMQRFIKAFWDFWCFKKLSNIFLTNIKLPSPI